MKKIMFSILACLLFGCQKAEVNPIDEAQRLPSFLYGKQGEAHNLNVQVFYPLRVAAVNAGEMEKVVFVYGNQDMASEVTISDPDELAKFAAYFKSIQFTDKTTSLGPGTWIDLEVTLKGKEPLYFRFNQLALCTGECVFIETDQDLISILDNIKGEHKDVSGMPVYPDFMRINTWADIAMVIPHTSYQSSLNENMIIDTWVRQNRADYETLKLVNFIDKEFDQGQEIPNNAALVAALVQQADKYSCYGEPQYVCRNQVNDLLYMPKDSNSKGATPWVYSVTSRHTVEKLGKTLFGEVYNLPDLNDFGYYQGLQGYSYNDEEQLFYYTLPYEYFFATFKHAYPIKEEIQGDLHTYTLLKYTSSFARFENEPKSTLVGKNGYTIIYNQENEIEDILIQNQEYFEKWKYVLQEINGQFRFVSGHCLNRTQLPIPVVNPDKEAYYIDEHGDLKVNLASHDAALFNDWLLNQKILNQKYKANIHEGLLSIWLYDAGVVVFDLATQQALTTKEVIDYLNIDEKKLNAAFSEFVGIEDVMINTAENTKVGDLPASSIFINSQGKLAYNQGYSSIILFEWEEAR